MKFTVILALAGLSTATPAVVRDKANSAGGEATPTGFRHFFLAAILSPSSGWSDEVPLRSDVPERSYRFQRRAEPAEGGVESSDEVDDAVTTTFIGGENNISSTTTSDSTSNSESTEAQTQATVTRTVIRVSAVASAKAKSSRLTTSSSPDKPRSDAEVEVNESLDGDLEEFMGLDWYSRLAQEEDVPSSYEQAFENQNAIASHQAIQTERLAGYDATECAEHCNRHRACEAFSIFVERQPPCMSCSVHRSNKLFMCKLYNTHLKPRTITNKGNEQNFGGRKFTLAIRASNGYNRLGRAATVTVTTTHAIVSVLSAPRETKTITMMNASIAPRRTITKTSTTYITTTVATIQHAPARETVAANAIANTRTRTVTTIQSITETITKATTTTVPARSTYTGLDLTPNDEEGDGVQSARRPKTQYWRS